MFRKAIGLLLLGAGLFGLPACTAVAGGAVAGVLVAVGALTSSCYDYIDVTVLDDQGRKTCAATVSASRDGGGFELTSCFYAPLSDGRWTLRAAQPGYSDAVTAVEVEHAQGCTRHVQSVELTLTRAGAVPARQLIAPRAAPTPTAPPSSSANAPAPERGDTSWSVPTTSPAASAPLPLPSAAPATSSAPAAAPAPAPSLPPAP